MSEGGLGSKLENIRSKLPFFRKKTQHTPVVPEEKTEPAQVDKSTMASVPSASVPELRRPEDYRQKAAEEILGTIRLQQNKGSSQSEIIDLIRDNPICTSLSDETIQEIIEKQYKQPKETLDSLVGLLPEKPPKEDKQSHKQWTYQYYIQPSSEASSKAPLRNIIREFEPEPRTGNPDEEQKLQRKVAIEKSESTVPIHEEGELEREIVESGILAEIPKEDVEKIISDLRTLDPLEILRIYRPEMVRTGKFERFLTIKKGSKGTILYYIDQEGVLHLRLGIHKRIYAVSGSHTR